jgi:hypothetical protein
MVSRGEVESGDASGALEVLRTFAESADRARFFRRRVLFGISGYDNDPRGLFEIEEVRAFVNQLDSLFPHWLWFLSPRGRTLSLVAFCHCRIQAAGPHGTVVDQDDLHRFIETHLASLHQFCRTLGLSIEEAREAATGALEHFFGPGIRE